MIMISWRILLNLSNIESIMKRTCSIVLSLFSLVFLASCAPEAFLVSSQMRTASSSGLNLSGKSMAVVYQVDGSAIDTTFTASFSSGFASGLEKEYFDGSQEVGFFTVPKKDGVDYACKDSMVSLVMQTGKDVVFLVSTPEFGKPVCDDPIRSGDDAMKATVKVPFSANLYAYDSMDKNDKVVVYNGEKSLSSTFSLKNGSTKKNFEASVWNNLEPVAETTGLQASSSFAPNWKDESFIIVYYPLISDWVTASEYAVDFQWKKALEKWLTLTDTGNREKKSCLCYDIALSCFMLGQPLLAYEWLDRSDSEAPLSISKDLRKKISEYSGVPDPKLQEK